MKKSFVQFLLLCSVCAVALFSCKSGKKTESQNDTAKVDTLSAARPDTISSTLDAEGPELTELENSPIADTLDIKTDIALSRYKDYLSAIGELPKSQAGNAFGAMKQANQAMVIMLDPTLNEEAIKLIEELPDPLVSKLIILKDKLLKAAQYLNTDEQFGAGEIYEGKPVRKGIKYAWGSKQFNKKCNPKALTKDSDKPSECNQNITGLDCSGMIYQLFQLAGEKDIQVPAGNAETLRQTRNMTGYLKNYFNNSPRFSVVEKRRLLSAEVESGDIIYFYTIDSAGAKVAFHIGIGLKTSEGLKFFHCSGGRNSCDKNLQPGRGITCVKVGKYLDPRENNGVIRMTISPEKKPNT